ncbi:hypothetical protein ACFU9X_39155 [Streptomyces atratus]|uniref:hypothetical protein n=1 Tax=Streptomyces atratus TaxID=1893 RepID=UPI0036A08A15
MGRPPARLRPPLPLVVGGGRSGIILDRHHGTLRDDATVLLLEWHGPTLFGPGQAEALVGLPE